MTDIVERRYDKDRNPMELEPWFSKHMSSMTGEDLHSKADIAQELAYRDQEIESLRQQLAECQAKVQKYRGDIASYIAMEQGEDAVANYLAKEAEYQYERDALRKFVDVCVQHEDFLTTEVLMALDDVRYKERK